MSVWGNIVTTPRDRDAGIYMLMVKWTQSSHLVDWRLLVCIGRDGLRDST